MTCTGQHQVDIYLFTKNISIEFVQIFVYDPRVQRRPVSELVWLDEPFASMSTCAKAQHVIAGNTRGEMALFDLRNKGFVFKLSFTFIYNSFFSAHPVHKFKGFAGSIRSIDAHSTGSYVASCGIDRFVRIHDVNTKKLIKKVYHLRNLISIRFLICLDLL